MKRLRIALTAVALMLCLGLLLIAWLGLRSDVHDEGAVPAIAADITNRIERGAYLARAGNCRGCHTERGGTGYAGGRAIAVPAA